MPPTLRVFTGSFFILNNMKLKGVNLGGWLVLERWITPSVFEGLKAWDETAFCIELGEQKHERLEKHRQNFITEEDFKWISGRGLNCVRIPVPHWIFGDIKPYAACMEYLDKAFEWARKYSLKIIIDVHTAPGSQNGYKHSGTEGRTGWHKHPQNIGTSLNFLKMLAERYGRQPALAGIELLNEPSSNIPGMILGKFYEEGYKIVREHCPEEVAVIISDSFKPYDFIDVLSGEKFNYTILDIHLYQCFAREDRNLGQEEHIEKTKVEWGGLIKDVQETRPAIIGEWSLALPAEAFEGMDENQKKEGAKAYGQAQLDTFSLADGWLYWTYKTESQNTWNFRHCVETDLLPGKF